MLLMKTFAGFLILLLVYIASCLKDEVPGNTIPDDQVVNTSGNYWEYSIKSSPEEQKVLLEMMAIKKSVPDARPLTNRMYSYP